MARHAEILDSFKEKMENFDYTNEEHMTCVRRFCGFLFFCAWSESFQINFCLFKNQDSIYIMKKIIPPTFSAPPKNNYNLEVLYIK